MQKKEMVNDQLAATNPTARNFQRPDDEDVQHTLLAENGGDEDEDEDEPIPVEEEEEIDLEEEEDEPDLDEEDLEENDLTVEEADDVEWDPGSGKSKPGKDDH